LTSSVRRYSIFFTSVSNSSLYVKSFLSSAVKIVFRTQDKLLRESTRARKGLALVRLFLLLKLFSELGVGLLKIAEIVLEKPYFLCDEDINYNLSTSMPAAPFPATPDAPPPQAPPPSGPITRAHARELNFIMLLKNEGPEE
jgi:hypothetical protein